MESELIIKIEKYYKEHIPSSRASSYFPHVNAVRKYGLMLADRYNANKTIVEIAALLHDIGADAGEVHAFKSAEMANELLSDLNIDNETKGKIVSAIKNHSMNQSGQNFEENIALEDQIIRDADGLSFLENSYEAYLEKGIAKYNNIEQAKEQSIKKINGMMKKITTPEGHRLAEDLKDKALNFIKNYKGA